MTNIASRGLRTDRSLLVIVDGAKALDICVERDPAFAALGRHLGFEVLEQDFNELEPTQFAELLDGLWAKGTFNGSPRGPERSGRTAQPLTR